ncbi:MAG: COR domain-containing protein, partial [Bacteroidia bacterium]|nr:COR domain-containing protein [Bacteroidia bacterium]
SRLPGITLHEAPLRGEDRLGGLMPYKRGTPKYALSADGQRLIGLNLAKTGLTDAQWADICALPGFSPGDLEGLNLSENQLTRFTAPPEMRALRWVNLCENPQMASCVFEGKAPALWRLDLSECALTSLRLPGNLASLAYLDLSSNQLDSLEVSGALPALAQLDLRRNRFEQLPASLSQSDRLRYLYLGGNPMGSLPKEVIPGGDWANAAESVLAYLKATQTHRSLPLYQAKMILVGNGEVGKTSIRLRLVDPEARLPEKHERTNTLDIAPYVLQKLPPGLTGLDQEINFQLNIWDFGGQGKYREVQQLFCSRKSIYLFVTACDDQPGRDDYVGFEYWLDMVNAYSYDAARREYSPVVYVINKTDLGTKLTDEQAIAAMFPNIHPEFIRISCEKRENLDKLEQTIRAVLPKAGQDLFTDTYPEPWMSVKSRLESLARERNFIPYPEYLGYCEEQQIGETEAHAWIGILDRIGSVIYFGSHPGLRDWVILNPVWVKEIMYHVLDSRYIMDGVLKPAYFGDIWPGYSAEETRHFLALMEAYQLCYSEISRYGETEYVIPALLRKEVPLPAHLRKDPAFRIRFIFKPFIPAGTVSKLIVHVSRRESARIPEEQAGLEREAPLEIYLKWRNNVVLFDPLAKEQGYAHVIEVWEEKAVYVNLYGGQAARLYQSILAALRTVNQQLIDTKYLDRLELQPEAWYKDRWIDLSTLELLGLDLFSTPPEDRKRTKHAFIVYAAADDSYRSEFDDHLAQLKREGAIETWYDHRIEAGTAWDDEIRRQLQRSDLFFLLLSPDFMNVRYIWETELEIIRKRAGAAAVIPLFIRACDLEGAWFMAYQGAGKRTQWIGSVLERPLRDEAWLKVVQEIRAMLDENRNT